MNDAILDAGTRPGGRKITVPGRFLGNTPAVIGGVFALLLIGGIMWGAVWRMESGQRIETVESVTDSTPRASNSLGEFLEEAEPAPEPEPETEPELVTAIALPPLISEAEQAQRDFMQQQKMLELQNRTMGKDSSILISTSGIRTNEQQRSEPGQTPASTGNQQRGVSEILNPALAALVADASQGAVSDQEGKLEFLEEVDRSAWLPHTPQTDLGPLTLKTGTVIPGVLISGLNSDLPGNVIAQVSQNVYDSATGRYLLIPQGAKMYGTYDSRVNYGQNRALVVWERIIFPDASTLEIDRMQGVDVSGQSGYKDKVNNHYWRTFGQLFLLSAIQAAPGKISGTSTTSGDDEFSRIIAANMSAMGEKLTERNLSIQPTIRIRPGYQFLIMVNKDMLFRRVYGA